ncbi:MAG: membrane protein insertase YidC [Planctomycetaceae bacterium]
MKQQHRLILFMILSMGLYVGWINIGPKFFPNLFFRNPPAPQKLADKNQKAHPADRGRLTATQPPPPPLPENPKPPAVDPGKLVRQPPTKKKAKPKQPAVDPGKLVRHPSRKVRLGTLDPRTGYFIQVELASRGAAVEFVKLNDERYRTVDDPNEQLKVVGSTGSKFRTFETTVDDKEGARLRTVNWKVDDKATVVKDQVTTDVTFTYQYGSLRFTKRYWLKQVDLSGTTLKTAQDTQPRGYELHFQFKVENLGSVAKTVTYELQGPVGVPLENRKTARSHRRLINGFLQEDGSVKTGSTTAVKVTEDDTELKGAIRYIGVDVQYFAAMVIPGGDQLKASYVASTKPEVIAKPANHPKYADISVLLTSQEYTLAPAGGKGASISHEYTLFAGPKRKELLEPYSATGIIDYGWFGFIARGMLWLLNFFHGLGAPYWLAIILLTACVRGAMFPLSRKQAKSANKMKELQPKIAELKKKHEGDREKLAKAQMELFSKHGYNPLAGCLPIFLQLPIFIGLYQSLSNAVQLRLAPFLWFDNLAAPDALFSFGGFEVPWLGWTTFNLLPLITIVLFIAQQKMFMPPATDEQTAMQQKMMMYMSIFFGFLFYTVPSGLCLYFIVSSLWGMGERKLLGRSSSSDTPNPEAGGPDDAGPGGGSKPSSNDQPDKRTGFFGKLLNMADEAAAAKARGNGDDKSGRPERKKKAAAGRGSGKRKKGRKRR